MSKHAAENDARPLAYLRELQAEADGGFHRSLRAWVDDDSSVARTLRDYATRPIPHEPLYVLATHDEEGMETTLHSTGTEAYEALREYLNDNPVDYQDPLPESAPQDLIEAAANDRSQFAWVIQKHER